MAIEELGACPPFGKKHTGMKFDSGKLLFGCVTRGFAKPLKELAKVMTFGAKKYERDSWQAVPDAETRYEDALDRHLNAWKGGENVDPETGLYHLAHAAANIMFLLHFEVQKHGER